MTRSEIDNVLLPLLQMRARLACGSQYNQPGDLSLDDLDQQIEALRHQRVAAVDNELWYMVP